MWGYEKKGFKENSKVSGLSNRRMNLTLKKEVWKYGRWEKAKMKIKICFGTY